MGAFFERMMPRLPVEDLAGVMAFYEGVLGFEVDVVWPEERPTFAILCRDGVSVGFYEREEVVIGYAELYVEVRDCLGMHSSLQGKVAVEWGPEVYSYGRREFAVRDPQGYLVIFTEETEEEPTTREPGEG